jgi:phosphohistidine swiveling domain-containing protein
MTVNFILSPSSAVSLFEKFGGGKAYHLKKMFDLKLPVPEWVCLATPAFEIFVEQNKLSDLLENDMDFGIKEKKIEAEFLKADLPDSIKQELDKFFSTVNLEQDFFAVRSSGSDEDSKDASFAGQFSSYLFQKGRASIEASIKQCWASGFSERAMTYRREKKLPMKGIKVAVVIQRMLFPQAAGVCFSRNPIDPLDRDHLLISASWGVGEGIVSGLVSCDEIKVNRYDHSKTEIQIEEKKIRLDFANGKMEQVTNNEDDIKRLCLEPSSIIQLSELALHLEQQLACAQDIEFAVESGKVFLLQTRPVTHLPVDAFYDAAVMGNDRVMWDNSNIIESYSGVASPLTFSFASYTYRQVYRQFMEMMGISKKEIDDNDFVFRNLLGLVRGRFYYHLIYWYKLVLMLPGSENNKQFLETMMGVKKTLSDEDQKMFELVGVAEKKTPLKTKLYVTYMTLKNFLNINSIVGNFQRDFDKIYQDLKKRDFKKQSLNESINLYNYLEGEVLSNWKAPIINDYLCMIFFGLLKKLTDKWIETEGKVEGTQNDLLCGQGDLESTEPTKMLMRMSKKIDLEDPRMREKLTTIPVKELLQDKEVRDLIWPFLDRFGFRCANELKLEEPDLHDDPSFVVYTLANYIKMKTYHVEEMEVREKAIKSKAEEKVNKKLTFWQKPIYYWVVKHTRIAVRNRENLRFLRTKIFGITRHLMRGIGHNFHKLNLLNDPSHVFYLKIDEIRSIVEGRSLGDNYAKLAQDRFDLFNHYRKTPNPPDRFITKGAVGPYNYFPSVLSQLDLLKGFGIPDDPNMLIGTPCCPGVVEGVVRVAKEFADAEGLNGDILVTERTDPGWVPLYPSCSGLLIERGSLLSHSAVVARELGLPTIIGVNGGLMSKLKTGDRVRIDASTGIIQILREETPS